MSPSLAVAGTPSAASSASPHATRGQLVRRFARGHVLGARRSALPVVRWPPVRLLRERRVLARQEPATRDPVAARAAAVQCGHLVPLRCRLCRRGAARHDGRSSGGRRRSQSAAGARICPCLCASLCVPPCHSRLPNKPPSVQIKINGSAYSDGLKVKNVNIVPTGAPGSYSKSAIPLPPAQLVAGFPFTVQSALA